MLHQFPGSVGKPFQEAPTDALDPLLEDHSMNPRKLPLSIAAIAVLSLAGCKEKDAGRYTKDGLFIVRMASSTNTSETQFADSLGFWKEEGLQPEYVGTLTPGTEIPAALSEKVDVIGGHPNTIAKAVLAGAKIHITVNGLIDTKDFPHLVYHVQKKSGIVGIEGFQALARQRKIKIGVNARNGCSDWYLDEWLRAGGVTPDQIDWVLMPNKQQIEALSKGFIDVSTTHTPFIKPTDTDPNFHRVLSSFDIVHDPAAGGAFRGFTDKFIKQHPEQVAAFTRVMIKAHRWSNAHPDSAKRLLGRIFNQPVEKVDYRNFATREWINDSDINVWLKRQFAHKDIKPGTKIQASDIYTNANNSYWIAAGKPKTYAPLVLPETSQADAPSSLVQRVAVFFGHLWRDAKPGSVAQL